MHAVITQASSSVPVHSRAKAGVVVLEGVSDYHRSCQQTARIADTCPSTAKGNSLVRVALVGVGSYEC